MAVGEPSGISPQLRPFLAPVFAAVNLLQSPSPLLLTGRTPGQNQGALDPPAGNRGAEKADRAGLNDRKRRGS